MPRRGARPRQLRRAGPRRARAAVRARGASGRAQRRVRRSSADDKRCAIARGLVSVPAGAAAATIRRVRNALVPLAPRLRGRELVPCGRGGSLGVPDIHCRCHCRRRCLRHRHRRCGHARRVCACGAVRKRRVSGVGARGMARLGARRATSAAGSRHAAGGAGCCGAHRAAGGAARAATAQAGSSGRAGAARRVE